MALQGRTVSRNRRCQPAGIDCFSAAVNAGAPAPTAESDYTTRR
jgi:hypothetical protein